MGPNSDPPFSPESSVWVFFRLSYYERSSSLRARLPGLGHLMGNTCNSARRQADFFEIILLFLRAYSVRDAPILVVSAINPGAQLPCDGHEQVATKLATDGAPRLQLCTRRTAARMLRWGPSAREGGGNKEPRHAAGSYSRRLNHLRQYPSRKQVPCFGF